MTLSGPEFPLTAQEARDRLMDALGANYGGPTEPEVLDRALTDDALMVFSVVHPRPWATAARLIRDNTEYEVSKGLNAQIDRKLGGLETKQAQMDALAGILHLLPSTDGGAGWSPTSGAVDVRGNF